MEEALRNDEDEHKTSFVKLVAESTADVKNRKLTSLEGAGFDRRDMIVTLHDFLAAGDDTSATTLLWAFVLLANHPDVQSGLQAEVDDVIGSDRQPLLDDESKMPYTQAVILETMRRYTIVPLSLFRMTTCDTVLGDHFIPANTVVRFNVCNVTVNFDNRQLSLMSIVKLRWNACVCDFL
jgi:cytochrome P450